MKIDFDQLIVTGAASISGALVVSFNPRRSATANFPNAFTYGSITGNFNAIGANNGTITVNQQSTKLDIA